MGDNRKILIEIVTKTSGAEKKIKGVGNAADGAGKKADGARKSFFGLGKTLGAIARGFVIVKSFQLLARSVSFAAKTAADFEFIMAKVKATSKASEAQFIKLTNSAKALAAGTMFTATEVGELQLAYSKLGFTTDEILAATEATLQLATITGDSLSSAADVAGAAVRGFGLDASETQRVVDVMAASFSSSALNLENFKQSMKTVAPIARAANVSIEDTSALLAKLADAGLRGTRAATGLKNIMSALTDPTSDLAKELGFTVKNGEGVKQAFREMSKRGIDLSKATQLVDERSKAAFITLANGIDDVDALADAFENAEGSAESMSKTISDTLVGDFKKLEATIESVILSKESAINKGLRKLAQLSTEMVSFFNPVTEAVLNAEAEFKKFETTIGTLDEKERVAALTNKMRELRGENEEMIKTFKGLGFDNEFIKEIKEFEGLSFTKGTKDIRTNIKLIELIKKEIKETFKAVEEGNKEIKKGDATEALNETSIELLNLDDGFTKLNVTFDEFMEKLDEIPDELPTVASIFMDYAEAIGEVVLANEEYINGVTDVMFSANELFQVMQENKLNSIIASNDAEFEAFSQAQDDRLARYDLDQEEEIALFEGTQEQKAQFEKQKGLERLEFEKQQEQKREALRQKQLNAENKIAEAAFKANKRFAVAGIAINLAREISAIAVSSAGNPANAFTFGAAGAGQFAILSGLAIANAGLQTAAVSSQKFVPKTFQDGGMIEGASHAEGGVPFTVAGRAGFEAEGGEYIFSKNTVDRLGTGLLDAINFGGAAPRLFADGGAVSRASVASSALNQSEMAQMIGEVVASSVTQIPVVNVATQTDSLSRMVQNAEAMATI